MLIDLGYVINGIHPCLKTIDHLHKISEDDFVLIVGLDKAIALFPNLDSSNKHITNNIYWIYDKEESKTVDFYKELDSFLRLVTAALTKEISIKRIYTREGLDEALAKTGYLLIQEREYFTLSNSKEIYYCNFEQYKFLNNELPQVDKSKHLSFDVDIVAAYKVINKEEFTQPTIKSTKLLLKGICSDIFLGNLLFNLLEKNNLLLIRERLEYKQLKKACSVITNLSECLIPINKSLLVDLIEELDVSYLKAINEKLIDDKFINQSYGGLNTVTGRIFPPNNGFSLQTLSGKTKNIVCSTEDNYLVELDFVAFEYKIMAQLGDLPDSLDPHETLAINLFNDKSKRSLAKQINYAILYGAKLAPIIKKIVEELELSKSEEEALKQSLDQLLLPVKELSLVLEQEYKLNGYITNHFNRKIYPNKEYALLNNYISSTAADFLINKLNALFKHKIKVLLQNHDSILIECSKSNAYNEIEFVKTILERSENKIKGVVKVEYSEKGWGDLVDWDWL